MHIITQLFEIESTKTLLLENFNNNSKKWEIVDSATEYAAIKNGNYLLENRNDSNWNYYSCKTTLKKQDDFLIDASFEIQGEANFGHFGLIWGFEGKPEYLNKFTISPFIETVSVMNFHKNHRRVFHRFHNHYTAQKRKEKTFRLTIIKLEDYYYFLLNKKIVYFTHQDHFTEEGNHIGFYIEPGLCISVDQLVVRKLKSKRMNVVDGLEQLLF